MTIHLLHGIHTSRTSRRLANLAPIVAAETMEPVVYHEYGDIWAVETRWKNPGIAEKLFPEVKPGDALVGHSNGCAIWLRVLLMGAPARGLVLLNPALADDTDFSLLRQLEWVHLYYNDDDGAVPWAQRSPKILCDPLWGDMGRDGYWGGDWRVTQINCERAAGLPKLSGHSAILQPTAAYEWARYWGRKVRLAS